MAASSGVSGENVMIRRSGLTRWSGKSTLAAARRSEARRDRFRRLERHSHCRPLVETLEARRMLDGTQWLVVFRDLTLGTTLDEQALGEQQFLYDYGIQ